MPKKAKGDKPSRLLVDLEVAWYEVNTPDEWTLTGPRNGVADELLKVTTRATEIYKEQVKLFKDQRTMSKSDVEWLKTVEISGTASDKTAAFLLRIQEAPFYLALDYLSKLLEMAKANSRHESFLAVESLKEAFLKLLPPADSGRNLVYSKQRKWSVKPDHLSRKTLAICYFEEGVKRAFFEYLKIIEVMAQDQVSHGRERAIRVLWTLGMASCEQGSNILSILANKLGDPERKIASRVVYYLQEIVNTRNDVTESIVGMVQQVIQRPGISEKAQYYGLTFLSQLRLSHKAPNLPGRLLEIYLVAFKVHVIPNMRASMAIKEKSAKRKRTEIPTVPEFSRLAKVVLTGINRALPFFKGDVEALQTDLLVPVQILMKTANCSAIIQALGLHHQIVSAGGSKDGFAKALQDFLDGKQIVKETSTYPQLFALLFKAMVANTGMPNAAIMSLVKSLISSCFRINSEAYTASTLLLLDELLRAHPSVRSMITDEQSDVGEARLEDGLSISLFELNLLSRHYNPVIASYATALLESKRIRNPMINPFESMSNLKFLDEFIASSLEKIMSSN